MRNRVIKAATLVVALGFIALAAVAAGGGKKKSAPVKPAPVAGADAGAQDAGAAEDVFGGPRYFPASKAPGGLFLDVRPGAGAGGLGTRKPAPDTQKAPQPAPQQQAPSR